MHLVIAMLLIPFGKLVILNGDGTLHTEITCSPSNPFDVTCLDDTTVAVSTIYGIEIIDINSTKTERRIKTVLVI
jgi:hypothetical protein